MATTNTASEPLTMLTVLIRPMVLKESKVLTLGGSAIGFHDTTVGKNGVIKALAVLTTALPLEFAFMLLLANSADRANRKV